MKTQIKKIGLLIIVGLSIISCTPNDPVDGNQYPNGEKSKLLSIKSNASGNACNQWDLQEGNTVASIALTPSFLNLRSLDPIVSPAGLLAQTTMTWQSSAYDNVNKKYAVALGETVVIYDLSSSSVPTPTTYVISTGSGSGNFILAMEYVAGQLYVIHNNEIKKFNSGVFTSLGITLPSSGISSNTMSNMTKNGSDIYFILKGKLYTFNTTSLSITSTVVVSGWSTDIDYNGLEYYSGKIYCAKRFSSTPFSTTDQFVSIDLLGTESTIVLSSPYGRDWSRISSAVDLTTGIYYLSSSNGFSSGSNTMTEINLTSGSNTSYSITGYQFGLQFKN